MCLKSYFERKKNISYVETLVNSKLLISAAMEEHRATCEKEGRYVEAEMAKNRIIELKEQEF